MKAFAYCRVSSLGQAGEERGGIPRQREAITLYAAAHGIKIVQWFEDSVSGTRDMDNRPQFQAMLIALLADGVKTVIVERLDRLARDLMIQEKIISDFKRKKFDIISTCEPDLCSEDAGRVLMRQIMGAISQYERTLIVAKTQAAKIRKRATDPEYREGRLPFGDTRYPAEAATVQRILKLKAEGLNDPQICKRLIEEKLPTRDGGKWFPQQVARIVERYSAQQTNK